MPRKHRSPFWVISLILVLILSACNLPKGGAKLTPTTILGQATLDPTPEMTATPEASPTTGATPVNTAPPASSGACSNTYFPTRPGSTWTYANTSPMVPDSTTTRTLSAITSKGFVVNDLITPNIKLAVKWSCKKGDLAMLESATISSKAVEMYVKGETVTGYLIPAAIAPGQTWSETLGITSNGTAGGKNPGFIDQQNNTQIDCKAGGNESITVPAGKFNAVKVTCNYTIKSTTTINDVAGSPLTNHVDITDWYVPGVGSVKTEKAGDIIETHELVSYSIP